MSSRHIHLFAVTCVLLEIYLQPGECQVYSWTNQPGDIYNQPCNSDQLNFTWTYTPASPDPALIEWSKQNTGGTFDVVATFGGGFLTPGAAYTGRVVRMGNTAELGLINATSADDGTYRVTVSESGGQTLTSDNVLVSTATTSTLTSSGITATCGVDGKTVTCAGVTSLGIPGAILTLSYASTSKDNGGTQTTVSEELTSPERVTCSISGPATECLGEGITKSASVDCGAEPPPTTTTPSATSTTPGEPLTTPVASTTPTEGLSTGEWIGAGAGVVGLLLIAVIILCICKHCKKKKVHSNDGERNEYAMTKPAESKRISSEP